MLKEERLQQILLRLEESKKVRLGDLSAELAVSEDTIRRDIRELSTRGLLTMVRGGAIPHAPGPRHFTDRIHFANKDKALIASKALEFVQNDQVIIFDGGTSALAVASVLPKDLRLTVATNSFPVATLLEDHPRVDVLFAGGRLYKDSFVTTGHETIRFFQQIRADVCFLGICSIHLRIGITSHYYEEAEVKKAMVAASNMVVALATPEKIDTAEPYYICPTTDLHTIITTTPDDERLELFRAAGIRTA